MRKNIRLPHSLNPKYSNEKLYESTKKSHHFTLYPLLIEVIENSSGQTSQLFIVSSYKYSDKD